jgi:hypothetical protein
MAQDTILIQQASGTATNTKLQQAITNLQGGQTVTAPAVTLVDASGNDAVGAVGIGAALAGASGILGGLAQITAAVQALQTQIHADLLNTNSDLSSLLTSVGNVQTAVNAVTVATQAVQTAIGAGNASETTIASQTASLTSALTNLQAFISSGNTALGTLHTDGLNLQGLVTTGNAALAAIQTATAAGATAAAQGAAQTTLNALLTAANTENTTLSSIDADVKALGTTLGGGATLQQIVTSLNPLATTANITALSNTLSTIENNELSQLVSILAQLQNINTNTPVSGQAISSASKPVVIASDQSSIPVISQGTTLVAFSVDQFAKLLEKLDLIAQESALTNTLLANELRVDDDLNALRGDCLLIS